MSQAVIRYRVLAWCACAAFLASPVIATAQQRIVIDGSMKLDVDRTEWVEGLSQLTAAVAGTYGDEGGQIVAALDKMASGLGKWDQAIQAFETQRTSTLAGMYLERGRIGDALRELDAAIALEPRRADLHVLRGFALDASGRSADADRAFRAGWALDAGDPIKAYYVLRRTATADNAPADGAREALAEAYRSLSRDKPRAKAAPFIAIGVLRESASEEPVLPPVAYAQGFARIARGEYTEAIAEFRKAAANDPLLTDPAARSASMTQAVTALRQGRLEQARALLEGAEALRDSSEAHRVLGLIHWANAQDDKSIGELEIAIRRNPRDERSRLALARVLSSAGRDQDAERALQETIQLFPDSAQARWWLGLGHERVNRFADARREFELAAPSAVAGRSRFFAKIGQLAAGAADFPGAVQAFARSVSLDLNDPEPHKQLAGALLQEDRAEEAFVELVAALLIDPLDAGAHFGIGQIALNAGRYDEAVTALRRAVELSDNHAEARYALATALMRSGNTQGAAREFDRVEQAQRQALADRRRSMSLDVLKEEAALRTAEGNYGAAIALYEKAITFGADPGVYRQLAELYMKVGRVDDAARAKARAR